jgi:hypothetical protein
MNALVADRHGLEKDEGGKQFKVDLDPDLQRRVEQAFAAHGANKKTGTARLFEWFVGIDADLRVLILARNAGTLPVLYAKSVLREAGEEPRGDGGRPARDGATRKGR